MTMFSLQYHVPPPRENFSSNPVEGFHLAGKKLRLGLVWKRPCHARIPNRSPGIENLEKKLSPSKGKKNKPLALMMLAAHVLNDINTCTENQCGTPELTCTFTLITSLKQSPIPTRNRPYDQPTHNCMAVLSQNLTIPKGCSIILIHVRCKKKNTFASGGLRRGLDESVSVETCCKIWNQP